MTDTPTPTPSLIPGLDEPIGWEVSTFEPGEIATVVIIYLGFAIQFAFHVYGLVVARGYKPLQARQPVLSFVSLMFGIILLTASFYNVRVIPIWHTPVVGMCQFINNWLYQLGYAGFLCTLFFRIWRLFVVFKFRKSWTKFHMYGPVVLIAVIGLILSIVNHVAEMYGIYVLVTGETVCWATWDYVIIELAYGLAVIVAITVTAVLNRKIPLKHFNEYRQTVICFSIIFFMWVAALVLNVEVQLYHLWGRLLFSYLMAGVVYFASSFSVIMPIYHFMTDRDEYDRKFRVDMKQESSDSEGSHAMSKSKTSKNALSGASIDAPSRGSFVKGDQAAVMASSPKEKSTLDADGIISEMRRMSTTNTEADEPEDDA